MANFKTRLLQLGSATAILGGLSAAFALDGRGCVIKPLHGDVFDFPNTTAARIIQIGGGVNKDTTAVRVEVGRPSSTPGAFQESDAPISFPVDTVNDTFSDNLSIRQARWPDNDIVALRFKEQLANGTVQALDGAGVGPGNYYSKYNMVGIADRPPSSSFPAGVVDPNQAVPMNTFSSSQSSTTFLSRKGLGQDGHTNYRRDLPDNLSQLFGAEYPIVAVAAYKNDGDLGFGRLLLCSMTFDGAGVPSQARCAVKNYQTAEDAMVDRNPIATVAMDRPNPGSSVYFAAYNAAGSTIEQVPLDGGGDKRLPYVCLNCHGGTILDPSSLRVRARFSSFLPFDLSLLSMPSGAPDQSDSFRALNQLTFLTEYMNTTTSGGAGANFELMDLLLTMYESSGGLFSDTSTFDAAAVPDGWFGNRALYTTVVAPYCRGCHIAFRGNLAFHTESAFTDSGTVAKIKQAVCDKTAPVMPHAQRVYHRFWASGARAALAIDLGFNSCAFKTGFVQ